MMPPDGPLVSVFGSTVYSLSGEQFVMEIFAAELANEYVNSRNNLIEMLYFLQRRLVYRGNLQKKPSAYD